MKGRREGREGGENGGREGWKGGSSLVIKDLVYETKAKIFSQDQGKDLHDLSSRILEAKARPRGQQDWVGRDEGCPELLRRVVALMVRF